MEPTNEYYLYVKDLIASDIPDALSKIDKKAREVLSNNSEYIITEFTASTSTYNHLTVDATITYWSGTIGGIRRV